jgi:hypothetical protein
MMKCATNMMRSRHHDVMIVMMVRVLLLVHGRRYVMTVHIERFGSWPASSTSMTSLLMLKWLLMLLMWRRSRRLMFLVTDKLLLLHLGVRFLRGHGSSVSVVRSVAVR